MEKIENKPKNNIVNNTDLEKATQDVLYYLVVLNTPLNSQLVSRFMGLNPFIVCGDGGANRFFTVFGAENKYLPNIITGDFDSITPETRKFYESKGVPCLHDPDQNSTDLDKAMKQILKKVEENCKVNEKALHKIIITGCLGERFDHNLSSFSNLLRYTLFLQNADFIKAFTLQIIHQQSIITCVLPGRTIYNRSLALEKRGDVGLFPLAGPCKKIETQGLKWNLG